MMFIIRNTGETPQGVTVKLTRTTPAIVPDSTGKTDFFCIAEPDEIAALRDRGAGVVDLHDGYYEDGKGGGVAIWGQGRYWEIRDTPFTVKEAVGPSEPAGDKVEGEHVEVRRAIFGA